MWRIISQINRLHRLYTLNKLASNILVECPMCEGDGEFYDPNREHISERSFDCTFCGGTGKVPEWKYDEFKAQFPKPEKYDSRIPFKEFLMPKVKNMFSVIPDYYKARIIDFDEIVARIIDDVNTENKDMHGHITSFNYQMQRIWQDMRYENLELSEKMESFYYDKWYKAYKPVAACSALFDPQKRHTIEDAIERYDLAYNVSDLKKYTDAAGLF